MEVPMRGSSSSSSFFREVDQLRELAGVSTPAEINRVHGQ